MQTEHDLSLLEDDIYEEFYHALAKMYVSLVDCPFVLERFCMKLYRDERFCYRTSLSVIDEAIKELQS